MATLIFLILQIVALTTADIYFHNPRGSNNRLDESGRERRNANRMFDSQNNNRGGYNVGGVYYYTGSILTMEWTNQHSCNGPNNNCELIIQYMCHDRLRDGTITNTIPERKEQCKENDCNKDFKYGMHEDYEYYMKCKTRERNRNLFTADQELRGRSARYTRQNPKGTRRGYECPEERDYYPYWGPSPWKDIVIMTSDTSRCDLYKKESQNVKDRYECIVPNDYLEFAARRRRTIPNNKEACEDLVWREKASLGKIGKWVKVPNHGIPAPECISAPWSRDNHLGNGMGGYANTYNWTVPNMPHERCAFRMRYNISTNDFDSWKTDASHNGSPVTKVDIGKLFGLSTEEATKRGYVFKTNPEVQALSGQYGDKLKLRLAINTAQYGRTFQDRSHMFAIRKRPTGLQGQRIFNVNVRGKRGNIVQVYPAVEYDFVPNVLTVSKGDYIHFQWTGSNSNPGNNDGQGQRGSDRSNVVLQKETRNLEGTPGIANPTGKFGHWGVSYPQHLDKTTFLGIVRKDLIRLAILRTVGGDLDELNDAGTYFDLGPRKVTSIGTFHYMCTRNNNFSNRSQKGKIKVVDGSTAKSDPKVSQKRSEVLDEWIDQYNRKDQQDYRIEKLSKDDGETLLAANGGKMDVGRSYASDFVSLQPKELKELKEDPRPVKVKLKLSRDPSLRTKVHYSADGKSWTDVVGVKYRKDMASFKAKRGGLYVARNH